MPFSGPKFLSELSADQLEAEANANSIPKWNSLCLLKLLKLPHLDSAFIPPKSSKSCIKRVMTIFRERLNTETMLIRSDAGIETKDYFRGGNTFPIDEAINLSFALSSQNRAVLLMEPTDRFCNRLSVNAMLGIDGTFCLEILGPGYDVSDLNRGGILPQYTIVCAGISWRRYERLRAFEMRPRKVTLMHDESRRSRRLTNIGRTMLPSHALSKNGEPAIDAELWLKTNGYLDLWRPWEFSPSSRQVQSWFEAAYLVANRMSKTVSWKSLSISGSELADRRFIYWDIVNGSHKIG